MQAHPMAEIRRSRLRIGEASDEMDASEYADPFSMA
jgi:hypothetical protein